MSTTAILEEMKELRARTETLALDLHDASIRVDENREMASKYLVELSIAQVERDVCRARVEALIEAAQALSNEARVNNGEPELIIDPQTLAELDMAVAVLATNTEN